VRNRKITAAAAAADSVAARVAAHFAGLLLCALLSLSLSLCGSLKVGRCLRRTFHQQKWLMQMDLSRAFVIGGDRKDTFSKITVTINFEIRSSDNEAARLRSSCYQRPERTSNEPLRV
jgi:hypothetical protein